MALRANTQQSCKRSRLSEIIKNLTDNTLENDEMFSFGEHEYQPQPMQTTYEKSDTDSDTSKGGMFSFNITRKIKERAVEKKPVAPPVSTQPTPPPAVVTENMNREIKVEVENVSSDDSDAFCDDLEDEDDESVEPPETEIDGAESEGRSSNQEEPEEGPSRKIPIFPDAMIDKIRRLYCIAVPPPRRTVVVAYNLPVETITAKQLEKLFVPFGQILKIEICWEQPGALAKKEEHNFAFIYFSNYIEAGFASLVHKKIVNGQEIGVWRLFDFEDV